jgi:hypothetical protein
MTMSTVPSSSTSTPTTNTYHDGAQTLIDQIRAFRDQIPKFQIPEPGQTRRGISTAAAVPPDFIELATVAVRNSASLSRAGVDPEQIRDLTSYGDAYSPVADELESLALFIRHSVTVARNKAGNAALTTYALAQRLARRPETSDLAPHVADMRRVLKHRRKAKAQTPAPAPGAAPTPAPPVVAK